MNYEDDEGTFEPIHKKRFKKVPERFLMRCRGKHCYNKATALQTAALAQKINGKPISIYKCPLGCGWWHLTSHPRTKK